MNKPEPTRAPIDLRRPRDLGALMVDGVGLYFREFRTFVAITAAVVVPVQLIVGGIGLGQFTADYDPEPDQAATLVMFGTMLLLVWPLLTAMCTYALLDAADGRRPSARSAIQRGLDAFVPLLGAVVLYVLGVAGGLLLLILPGLYLAFRWVLFIQAVVVDGRRNFDALERSAELIRGSFLRVVGTTIATQLVFGGVASLIGAPFLIAAEATGAAAFQLIGQIVGGVLAFAPAAVVMSLLYFDQRNRHND